MGVVNRTNDFCSVELTLFGVDVSRDQGFVVTSIDRWSVFVASWARLSCLSNVEWVAVVALDLADYVVILSFLYFVFGSGQLLSEC